MHGSHRTWGCAPRPHHHERGCGPKWAHRPHGRWGGSDDDMDDDLGGGFGVRRPLRFLAHKLDLEDKQVGELARILDELKTDRAQAEVDRRRTLGVFADALSGEAFDAAKAAEAGRLRVQSAERVRDAVLKALGQIHALLNPDQRLRLAYLIRSGTLAV